MGRHDGLPSISWSLRGRTDEGDEAWLIRGISQKLYRCPGCHGEIEIGTEHTVVQFVRRLGGTDHHHWHRRCAEELLIPELSERAAGTGLGIFATQAGGARPGQVRAPAPLAWPRGSGRYRSTPGSAAPTRGRAPSLLLLAVVVFVPARADRRDRRQRRSRLAQRLQRPAPRRGSRRGRGVDGHRADRGGLLQRRRGDLADPRRGRPGALRCASSPAGSTTAG